jgi:pimeloyl-ACP methyl ester carboxylesterase
VTLRKPPKAPGATASLVGRMVGLLLLLAVFAGVVWVAATNSRVDAIERADPVVNAPGDHMEVDGRTIHVRRAGSAADQPLVLVHDDVQPGGLSLVLLADSLADQGVATVVPDLLGFGLSSRATRPGRHYTVAGQAELLGGILDELGLEAVDLAGVGWGGGVVTELAVLRPDLVSSLALVDTPGLPVPHGRWDSWEGLPFGVGEAISYNLEGASDPARDRFFRGCDTGGWCDAIALVDGYRRTVEVPGTAAAIRARRASGAASVASERIDEVTVPVLVIRSEGGRSSEEDAAELADRLPDARVEVVSTEWPPALSAPDELASVLAGG